MRRQQVKQGWITDQLAQLRSYHELGIGYLTSLISARWGCLLVLKIVQIRRGITY